MQVLLSVRSVPTLGLDPSQVGRDLSTGTAKPLLAVALLYKRRDPIKKDNPGGGSFVSHSPYLPCMHPSVSLLLQCRL